MTTTASSTSVDTTGDEEWVKLAMSNDSIVVNLLINLQNHNQYQQPKPPRLVVNWSVRQRRSKSNIQDNSHRFSPTTPLSWTLATTSSLSAADDDTSTRSKANGDSEKTASKRSRKKKTLPELKEEEKLLVKERRELKRELASLRMNLNKEKSTNEILKKIKLDLQPSYVEPLRLLSNDVKVQPSKASDHEFTLPDLNMPFDDPSADVICSVG